jgi:hypothetical protein
MFGRVIFAALSMLICLHTSRASDVPLPLCPGTSKAAASNPLLRQALNAAYPTARERAGRNRRIGAPCIYPYRALSFEELVVLITLGQEPGEACHGCSAQVSAVFLSRSGSRLVYAGRHEIFTEAGTFGSLGAAEPLRLGTELGVVIEGGGTFQGFSSSSILPFLIRKGRMEPIGPENGILTGASDCGARDPCREVNGQWHTEGKRFIVRYSGAREDGTTVDGSVVYELRDNALILASGAELAAEMEESHP